MGKLQKLPEKVGLPLFTCALPFFSLFFFLLKEAVCEGPRLREIPSIFLRVCVDIAHSGCGAA